MKSWATLDAGKSLERVHCPVLAIFGENDRIVDWRESVAIYRAALERAGNKDVTIRTFSEADHGIFTRTAEDVAANRWPHAPGYHDTMTSWLRERGFTE